MINDVRPFKALHYNPEKIDDIGQCLSQPYDVISPEQQDSYYAQHENNIIRLILGKKNPDDNEMNNPYSRAKNYLSEWKSKGILTSTTDASFWIYEQEFEIPVLGKKKVKGFIGKVRLSDYEEMRILPHEKVLKNPVQDRIKLTDITHTQFEYIWCLYQDPEFVIDSLLNSYEKNRTIVDYYEEEFKVRHKLWSLTDQEQCDLIHDTMKKSKIYIADGHHRYATMLHIRDEYRKKYPDAGPDAPWEFIMMYLVNYQHKGLTIRPTHRMLHDLHISNWDSIFNEIKTYFHVKEYSWKEENERQVRKQWLSDIRTDDVQVHKFGFYVKQKNSFYLLTLKDPKAYDNLIKLNFSSDWKLLDVNIANYLIFQEILGITEEELSLNTKIAYIVDPDAAVEKVKAGTMEGAVIVNPTNLGDVIKISENKEMMPRKSTFFYPKPVSGLVMYNMDI